MKGVAGRRIGAALLVLSAASAAWACAWAWRQRPDGALEAKLGAVRTGAGAAPLPCAQLRAQRPLVLLALGQSNAGNHGAAAAARAEPIVLIAGGRCLLARDPLPGATGDGGSVWQRLPAELARAGVDRPVAMSILAVDGTTIDAWTRRSSPLRTRLQAEVASMRRLDLAPDFVLWQQGEADARAGTDPQAYRAALDELQSVLAQAGAGAPILLARSTVCRSVPSAAIRSAVEAATAGSARFRPGPDTDVLQSVQYRHDGCHFSIAGLEAAAKMWAGHLGMQLSLPSR